MTALCQTVWFPVFTCEHEDGVHQPETEYIHLSAGIDSTDSSIPTESSIDTRSSQVTVTTVATVSSGTTESSISTESNIATDDGEEQTNPSNPQVEEARNTNSLWSVRALDHGLIEVAVIGVSQPADAVALDNYTTGTTCKDVPTTNASTSGCFEAAACLDHPDSSLATLIPGSGTTQLSSAGGQGASSQSRVGHGKVERISSMGRKPWRFSFKGPDPSECNITPPARTAKRTTDLLPAASTKPKACPPAGSSGAAAATAAQSLRRSVSAPPVRSANVATAVSEPTQPPKGTQVCSPGMSDAPPVKSTTTAPRTGPCGRLFQGTSPARPPGARSDMASDGSRLGRGRRAIGTSPGRPVSSRVEAEAGDAARPAWTVHGVGTSPARPTAARGLFSCMSDVGTSDVAHVGRGDLNMRAVAAGGSPARAAPSRTMSMATPPMRTLGSRGTPASGHSILAIAAAAVTPSNAAETAHGMRGGRGFSPSPPPPLARSMSTATGRSPPGVTVPSVSPSASFVRPTVASAAKATTPPACTGVSVSAGAVRVPGTGLRSHSASSKVHVANAAATPAVAEATAAAPAPAADTIAPAPAGGTVTVEASNPTAPKLTRSSSGKLNRSSSMRPCTACVRKKSPSGSLRLSTSLNLSSSYKRFGSLKRSSSSHGPFCTSSGCKPQHGVVRREGYMPCLRAQARARAANPVPRQAGISKPATMASRVHRVSTRGSANAYEAAAVHIQGASPPVRCFVEQLRTLTSMLDETMTAMAQALQPIVVSEVAVGGVAAGATAAEATAAARADDAQLPAGEQMQAVGRMPSEDLTADAARRSVVRSGSASLQHSFTFVNKPGKVMEGSCVPAALTPFLKGPTSSSNKQQHTVTTITRTQNSTPGSPITPLQTLSSSEYMSTRLASNLATLYKTQMAAVSEALAAAPPSVAYSDSSSDAPQPHTPDMASSVDLTFDNTFSEASRGALKVAARERMESLEAAGSGSSSPSSLQPPTPTMRDSASSTTGMQFQLSGIRPDTPDSVNGEPEVAVDEAFTMAAEQMREAVASGAQELHLDALSAMLAATQATFEAACKRPDDVETEQTLRVASAIANIEFATQMAGQNYPLTLRQKYCGGASQGGAPGHFRSAGSQGPGADATELLRRLERLASVLASPDSSVSSKADAEFDLETSSSSEGEMDMQAQATGWRRLPPLTVCQEAVFEGDESEHAADQGDDNCDDTRDIVKRLMAMQRDRMSAGKAIRAEAKKSQGCSPVSPTRPDELPSLKGLIGTVGKPPIIRVSRIIQEEESCML